VRKTEEEKIVEELVPKRFWKWKKVFGKAESECICYKTNPRKKTISHAFINLIGNIQKYNVGKLI